MRPPDEDLRRFLASSAIGYGLGGVYMLFMRRRMEDDFRRMDRKRKPPEDLWPSLAVAYMATIASVSWAASRDRMAARRLLPSLLVAKGVTTALFTYRFARTGRISYAVSALTDGSLFAAMSLLNKRAASSRDETGNVRRIAG